MITIKDVAKKAGVSIATVSRVINKNYPVSEDAKKKVLQAMQELNYWPNGIARSLRSNKTNLIGIVVPDISNPYFMNIAKAIEKKVSTHGYYCILSSTENDAQKEKEIVNMLLEKRVDSIVLASCITEPYLVHEWLKKDIDLVLVDRKIEDVHVDSVAEDNFLAAHLLTKHLISQGHTSIAIINGDLHVSTGADRYTGYQKTMENAGLHVNKDHVLMGHFKQKDAYEAVKNMLEQEHQVKPTAILAANNSMAEGAMLAIKEKGLKIPDDLSLVCIGNILLDTLIEPKLTHVEQSTNKMGKITGDLILKKTTAHTQSRSYETIVIPPKLIIHHSVKKLNE